VLIVNGTKQKKKQALSSSILSSEEGRNGEGNQLLPPQLKGEERPRSFIIQRRRKNSNTESLRIKRTVAKRKKLPALLVLKRRRGMAYTFHWGRHLQSALKTKWKRGKGLRQYLILRERKVTPNPVVNLRRERERIKKGQFSPLTQIPQWHFKAKNKKGGTLASTLLGGRGKNWRQIIFVKRWEEEVDALTDNTQIFCCYFGEKKDRVDFELTVRGEKERRKSCQFAEEKRWEGEKER